MLQDIGFLSEMGFSPTAHATQLTAQMLPPAEVVPLTSAAPATDIWSSLIPFAGPISAITSLIATPFLAEQAQKTQLKNQQASIAQQQQQAAAQQAVMVRENLMRQAQVQQQQGSIIGLASLGIAGAAVVIGGILIYKGLKKKR